MCPCSQTVHQVAADVNYGKQSQIFRLYNITPLLFQSMPYLKLYILLYFLPFLISHVSYPPIFPLLFCVIKFEQQKVDCVGKQIDHPLISRLHIWWWVWWKEAISWMFPNMSPMILTVYFFITVWCNVSHCKRAASNAALAGFFLMIESQSVGGHKT